jgi:hypothetical protein
VWAKLDDRFFENPKIAGLSPRAKLLYVAGLTYCAGQLSDGIIDQSGLRLVRLWAGVGPAAIKELEDAGRWELNGAGYYVHDWADYNPPAAQVKARQQAARDRMRTTRSKERS